MNQNPLLLKYSQHEILKSLFVSLCQSIMPERLIFKAVHVEENKDIIVKRRNTQSILLIIKGY